MKKNIGIISVLILMAGYVFVASPALTLLAIKKGIEEKNTEKLSESIAFPELRQNLKGQVSAYLINRASPALANNSSTETEKKLATKFADDIVDSLVTPSGLIAFAEDEVLEEALALIGDESGGTLSDELSLVALFKEASFSYEATSEISIWLSIDNDREMRFILQRQGLSWKLVNLVIPLDGGATVGTKL